MNVEVGGGDEVLYKYIDGSKFLQKKWRCLECEEPDCYLSVLPVFMVDGAQKGSILRWLLKTGDSTSEQEHKIVPCKLIAPNLLFCSLDYSLWLHVE